MHVVLHCNACGATLPFIHTCVWHVPQLFVLPSVRGKTGGDFILLPSLLILALAIILLGSNVDRELQAM